MLGRTRKHKSGKGSGHGRRGLLSAVRTARGGGALDSDIIFKIKQHLRRVYRIPADWIKTDHAVRIRKNGGGVVVGPVDRKRRFGIRGMVHTPDIVVVDEEGGIWFVIEQDGKIHDSKKVAKKDEERNRHYADAGIPCVVLKTSAIMSEGVTAAEYLDREMERLGVACDARDDMS